VEEALRQIGDAHRHVLVETHLIGRSYAEVAASLGVPEGTVKSRVYYGLRALRNVLEEMGYDA
jgi:RNA polymerase sigma-70 factor (ECF subfamily)